jgi:hypothetical protein
MGKRVLLALLLLALGLPLAAPTGAAGAQGTCGVYKFGDRDYILYADNLPCRKAKRWTRHIYRSPGHTWEPRRYNCNVLPNYLGGGGCRHKRATEKVFGWYVPD